MTENNAMVALIAKLPFLSQHAKIFAREAKMLFKGADPEPYTNKYTLVIEGKPVTCKYPVLMLNTPGTSWYPSSKPHKHPPA